MNQKFTINAYSIIRLKTEEIQQNVPICSEFSKEEKGQMFLTGMSFFAYF